MIRDFMVPLATLCACAVVSIVGLDRLCLFHQTYQTMVAKLESERWLLQQCSDPHFFSKMHQHSNLCFQVENNARVGAFMLALRQLTQSVLLQDMLASLPTRLVSWPWLAGLAGLLLLAPSWLVRTASAGPRYWPVCADEHFKNA